MEAKRRRIAIACQGGGSHTAFTAGVLGRLLTSERVRTCDVVGISGTSGGAVCALLAWYGLLQHDSALSARLLQEYWTDNAASAPADRMVNSLTQLATGLQGVVAMPTMSPYANYAEPLVAEQFRALLRRRVDFDALPETTGPGSPALIVGAVNVLTGQFKAFDSRTETPTPDTILASAALPALFRSVDVDGELYWDGLFSQNPPVRELLTTEPDEIWVIQINPSKIDHEPRTVGEIEERRNDLAGNLSLNQELSFIERIDQLLDDGVLSRDGGYRQVVVRVIELPRSRLPGRLGAGSKLNRDPQFLRALMQAGDSCAEEFLAAVSFEDAWRSGDLDRVVEHLDAAATFTATSPGGQRECHGPAEIQPALRELLDAGLALDLTRKQVVRGRAAWTVRQRGGAARVAGRVEAEFRDGLVVALWIGTTEARVGAGRVAGVDGVA